MQARPPLVVLVSALAFGACGGKTPAAPSAQTFLTDADLQFCVDETNRYRASAGRSALARSADVEAFAAAAAAYDHAANQPHAYYSANASGRSAENEALRWSFSPSGSRRNLVGEALATFWSEGPGGPHYENIAGPYTRIGCGAYVAGNLMTFVQEMR